MAIAKIITEGNTRMLILPDSILPDCDEVEIEDKGDEILLAPKRSGADVLRPATEDEFKKVSDKLMKENAVAYRELAK